MRGWPQTTFHVWVLRKLSALALVCAGVIGLTGAAGAAPLTLSDLDPNTDAVVQIEELSPGSWELSFIANTDLSTVTIGVVEKANVSGVTFLDQADNIFSFTDTVSTNSFVFSADAGIGLEFAANTAHALASFMYTNGLPSFDNTGVEAAHGFLLLKPDSTGIDLARVEFRVVSCGNSTLDPGEECDDGNTSDGDGCSADCLVEGEGVPVLPEPGLVLFAVLLMGTSAWLLRQRLGFQA